MKAQTVMEWVFFLVDEECLYFFSSLNFYYKWCLLRLFASLGCLNLRFALMQKKQKIIHGLLSFFSIHDPSLKGEQMK